MSVHPQRRLISHRRVTYTPSQDALLPQIHPPINSTTRSVSPHTTRPRPRLLTTLPSQSQPQTLSSSSSSKLCAQWGTRIVCLTLGLLMGGALTMIPERLQHQLQPLKHREPSVIWKKLQQFKEPPSMQVRSVENRTVNGNTGVSVHIQSNTLDVNVGTERDEEEEVPSRTKQAVQDQLHDTPMEVKVDFAHSNLNENTSELINTMQESDPHPTTQPNRTRIDVLPVVHTPAVYGSRKGHIECDVDVDNVLVYWNEPQGYRDREFVSPFVGLNKRNETKYVSFQPDRGGWNNIRMSIEIVFIYAATSGRTIVLPPEYPVYLLKADQKDKHRGFGDFFPLHSVNFNKRVPVITMEEFIEREGKPGGRYPIPETERDAVQKSSTKCENRAKSEISCNPVFDYLVSVGYTPQWNGKQCLIFDVDKFQGQSIQKETEERIREFCGQRGIIYYEKEMQQEGLVHFRTSEKEYRLLSHFYNFLLFTDPVIDHHYKRFVRDFLHYRDEIYCAAGKIVLALQEQGQISGFNVDNKGGGGYTSIHVRRGDIQYKSVKISAEAWYDNLKDTWMDDEIIYIATDEKDKAFFDPIANHHAVKFLDDFWDLAGLDSLDNNYFGMIDTIVASRGRTFGGTFYSTFSGYISRMRGYHGMSLMTAYYSYKPKKYVLHEWKNDNEGFSHEWPTGWVGIDGDVIPSREIF